MMATTITIPGLPGRDPISLLPSAIGTLSLRRMVAKRSIDNKGAKDAMLRATSRVRELDLRQGSGTRSGAQEIRNEGEGHLMFERKKLSHKTARAAAAAATAGLVAVAPAKAEDSVKTGLILPMTGGQASTGKQIEN